MSAKRRPLWVWFVLVNGVVLFAVAAAGAWVASKYLREPPVAVVPNVPVPVKPDPPTPPKPIESESSAAEQPEKAAPTEEVKPDVKSAATAPLSMAEIIQQVDGGIVLLRCKNSAGQEFSTGSGFVIDPAGLVATNFHVLRGASKIEAECMGGTKIEVKGCRAWSEEGDLAILELAEQPADMEVLPLCQDTDRPPAAEVIAIGHPQGLKLTTTTGIVSAIHTTAELPQPYRDFVRAPADYVWIQTNAAISRGNSGGPLLNRAGEVVGINTWMADGQNLGFAVDVRHLVAMAAQIPAEAISLATLTGIDEEHAMLVRNFGNKRQWLGQELARAKNEAEYKQIIETRHPALEYLPKLVDFAEKNRGKPAAFNALKVVCDIASFPDCPTGCNAEFKRAAERLIEDYCNDPRLVSPAIRLGGSPLEEAVNLARRLSQESTNRKVQAVSLLAISTSLSAKQGTDPRNGDEAVAILEKVKNDFGDVVLDGAKLSEAVEPLLFNAKYLSIGRQSPEIEGAELGGEKFRLSDYRGKVVVLDFWADWCPHCVRMYPLERQLVTIHAKAPFALLGINCDDPARLKQVVEQKKVTWRNWSDGPSGPISQNWRIEGFPTLYVLDHEGIIRYINVRDQELVNAVKELLARVPKADATADTEKSPAAPPPAAEPELRTWTSRDGRTAKFGFLGMDGEKVKLRREDGREVSSPLAAFSDDDQAWVKSQLRP